MNEVKHLCLSLWQPWASLLVHGKKQVETRGWEISYRGPLLIHAAQKWTRETYDFCRSEPFRRAIVDCGHSLAMPTQSGKIPTPRDMPFGAIIGRVNVVDCIPTEEVHFGGEGGDFCRVGMYGGWQFPAEEQAFGDYSKRRFAFLCKDFEAFVKPIPYRGAQGLFNVPDSVLRKAPA